MWCQCWPLWEERASWWRGSEPDTRLRSCLVRRPKLECGLWGVNREKPFLVARAVLELCRDRILLACYLPSSSTAMTAAPRLNKTCTTVARPFRAAMCRGLHVAEERGLTTFTEVVKEEAALEKS